MIARGVEIAGGFSFADLLPDGEGLACVLKAYFDESEREDATFCVAGLIFARGQVERFRKDWRAMLGRRKVFHMVDVVALKGEFVDCSREESNELIRRAVSIIGERARFAVVVSCNKGAIGELLQIARGMEGCDKAYPLCAHFALSAVGYLLDENSRTDKVAYVFEDGHPEYGDADLLMKAVRKDERCSREYHYYSHAFVPKMATRAEPLQAADVLAWEATKFQHETVDARKRPARKSFQALVLGGRLECVVHHLTPELVHGYLKDTWRAVMENRKRAAQERKW